MYNQDPVDYILAQVKENVKYLQSKGRVSESAANQINDLLAQPAAAAATRAAPVSMAAPVRAPTFSPPPSAPPFRAPPPPQVQPQVQHVRALFDYNVSSLLPRALYFVAFRNVQGLTYDRRVLDSRNDFS